ncbi:MAG: alanine racemase [Planctomycetota bacterium]|nr:MAG: alanine racemase [Planctomycetota bacterium]
MAVARDSRAPYLAAVNSSRVWADVDLDALAHNLARIGELAGPNVRRILVVKADAYGHGAVAIAHHAVRCGVDALGVSTSGEALELRGSGVRAPILILGTVLEEELSDCLQNDVQIGLHSMDRLRRLERLASRQRAPVRVHLKIDTGMGRLGVLPERALELLRAIRQSRHLELAGVMTHIAAADGARSDSTRAQLARFEQVLGPARSEGLLTGWVHCANSACLFTGLRPLYDAVRPGISAYGVLPPELPGAHDLEPVLALRAQIVYLKDLPSGERVGYDGTWAAQRRTRVATLPLGYNDGLPWRISNAGWALVRGRRVPIIGRVSMDYAMLDVTDVRGVRVGDVATLIGRDGADEIRVEELARAAGTIPYEITCSVGKRVRRIYRGGELPPRELPRLAPERRAAEGTTRRLSESALRPML